MILSATISLVITDCDQCPYCDQGWEFEITKKDCTHPKWKKHGKVGKY